MLRRPPESALPAAITVVDQPARWPAALKGHDQGIHAQACLEGLGHRPADDLASGPVLDGCQVHKPLAGRDGLSRWAFLLVKGASLDQSGAHVFNGLAGSRGAGPGPETPFTCPTVESRTGA